MITRNLPRERFLELLECKIVLIYHVSANVYRYVFPNFPKKRNLTAIPLILIPEYGQSNATLNYLNSPEYFRGTRLSKTVEV